MKKLTKEEFKRAVENNAYDTEDWANDEFYEGLGDNMDWNFEGVADQLPVGAGRMMYVKVVVDDDLLDDAYAEYCEEFADRQ